MTGRVPLLSIEITRECPLSCPGCYAYGETHLGGEVTLRQLHDLRGNALVDGVRRGEMGTGFGVPGVHVYFPVNKRCCLVLMDRATCEKRTIPPGHVREINKFLMIGARRYIYASEKNGYMAAVFSKIGCNSIPGKNAFMTSPPVE